jgi:hypothetical protein
VLILAASEMAYNSQPDQKPHASTNVWDFYVRIEPPVASAQRILFDVTENYVA